MPSSLRPPWREAGLLFSELQGHYSHQVWCERRPQDTVLREGVSWGSLGSFTQAAHTHCERLLSGGPSVWAPGRWRPMAQLTQGHHGVHFTCFWGPVSVCRDHESLSGTFRGSALPGYYRTPSASPTSSSSSISLQKPVLLRVPAVSLRLFQHWAFPIWNWDC